MVEAFDFDSLEDEPKALPGGGLEKGMCSEADTHGGTPPPIEPSVGIILKTPTIPAVVPKNKGGRPRLTREQKVARLQEKAARVLREGRGEIEVYDLTQLGIQQMIDSGVFKDAKSARRAFKAPSADIFREVMARVLAARDPDDPLKRSRFQIMFENIVDITSGKFVGLNAREAITAFRAIMEMGVGTAPKSDKELEAISKSGTTFQIMLPDKVKKLTRPAQPLLPSFNAEEVKDAEVDDE